MLNVSVQAASTAASTTGRYSGRQPASTALMATFSTVHSTRSGGTTATTSAGAREVPPSILSQPPRVGGAAGRAELREHGGDQQAGGTVAFDDGDETVGDRLRGLCIHQHGR